MDEVRHWDSTQHPIARLRAHLVQQGYWDEAQEKQWKDDCKRQVILTWFLSINICGAGNNNWNTENVLQKSFSLSVNFIHVP